MVSKANCSGEYFNWLSKNFEFTDSRSFFATAAVLRSVLALLATISNSLIIVSIKRTPSLHTPSYLLVVSQSVNDLCVGLLVQPLHTAWQVAQFKSYFHLMCIFFAIYIFISPLIITVSCFTMTAISFDRFLAIYTHSRYRTVVTRKRTIVGIIVFWVISGVCSYSTLASRKLEAFNILGFVGGVFCLVISSLSFFGSARLLQLQTRNINALAVGRFNFGKYKRSLVTMTYVYSLYLVCYVPLFTHFALKVYKYSSNDLFDALVIEIFYINSTLNSFVYFLRNRSLRMTIKILIGLTNNRQEIPV